MRRAISEPIDSSVSGDAVDLSTRHADVHQLPVTQLVQAGSQSLALAPLLKRTPISLEQAQDAPRRCGRWSSSILFRQGVSQRYDGGIGARRCQSFAHRVFHQRDGEVEAEPCGIAPGLGCEVRLLGWHRMLLLLRRQGAWPNKRPRPMPAGPCEKIASSNS